MYAGWFFNVVHVFLGTKKVAFRQPRCPAKLDTCDCSYLHTLPKDTLYHDVNVMFWSNSVRWKLATITTPWIRIAGQTPFPLVESLIA